MLIHELEMRLEAEQHLPVSHGATADCLTWHDGCHCTVETLRDNIERAEKAEDHRDRLKSILGGLLMSGDLNDLTIERLKQVGDEYRTKLETEHAAFKAFFEEAIGDAWDGHGMDGGDIQALGEKLGLLREVPYDPQVHGEDVEADPGDTIYVRAYEDAGRRILCPRCEGQRYDKGACAVCNNTGRLDMERVLKDVQTLADLRGTESAAGQGAPTTQD